MAASWKEPFKGYNWKLDIDGLGIVAHFIECDGIEVEITKVNYREGGDDANVHRLPGLINYSDVTFRYGLTDDNSVWEWFHDSLDSSVVNRREVSVILMKPDQQSEHLRWNLFDAWPSYWKTARLNAQTSELAIESMSLTFERLERA
ncbi:phage tail protein [Chitinispirillales bacterium ANBcel5]|uniref:phage tail protein n=1 Tax=Cellulosispirillum alkaliphilum TaxID=3039283 RepID=UPI002A4E570D|nr:phage tail protein [Chitinispirillales bacterium ANBcel5]